MFKSWFAYSGLPRERILETLEITKEVPGTTTLVEQGHAAGALLHKDHELYGEQTLADRALLLQQRPLFNDSKEDKLIARIQKRIDVLEAKMPQRLSGRAVFVKELASEMFRLGSSSASDDRWSSAQEVVKFANAYSDFPEATKRSYRRHAQQLALEGKDRIEAETLECQEKIDKIIEDRETTLADRGLVNHIKSCRFTSEDVEEMCGMMTDKKYTNVNLLIRVQALKAPGFPSVEQQIELLDKAKELHQEPAPVPYWSKLFIVNRDLFPGVAVYQDGNEASPYLFLFALQRPQAACFLALHRRDAPGIYEAGDSPLTRQEFDYLPLTFLPSKCYADR